MLLAGRRRAIRSLLPIVFSLLLAPRRALLCVERAVVIGIDRVETLAIEQVAFVGGHRRQLIVIGLAPFEARPLCRRQTGGGELAGETRLALRQFAESKVAVLLKGDQIARRGVCRRL